MFETLCDPPLWAALLNLKPCSYNLTRGFIYSDLLVRSKRGTTQHGNLNIFAHIFEHWFGSLNRRLQIKRVNISNVALLLNAAKNASLKLGAFFVRFFFRHLILCNFYIYFFLFTIRTYSNSRLQTSERQSSAINNFLVFCICCGKIVQL